MKKIIALFALALLAVSCGSTAPEKPTDYSKIDKSYNQFKGKMSETN